MYNLIEYSSNYSETKGSLQFYSKDEATNFNADIANTNNFKSFKYKARFLGSTEADEAIGILKNATIDVPLKYLSNFWISFEIPLINCNIKLNLKWTKYCALSAAAADNENVNSSNIIFNIKETKLYLPVVNFISKRQSKTIKTSYYNRYKTKYENKNVTKDIFTNQILLESIDCLFQFIQLKMPMLKDLKLEDIIYQKA